MTSQDACIRGTSRVLTLGSLQWFKMVTLFPAPADGEVRSMIVFVCTEYSADQNSSHWTRIRRALNSNPGAGQNNWGSFHGFPELSRQMLCYIFIATIHLTIIHKILKGALGEISNFYNFSLRLFILSHTFLL